jgi:hypothetical protein
MKATHCLGATLEVVACALLMYLFMLLYCNGYKWAKWLQEDRKEKVIKLVGNSDLEELAAEKVKFFEKLGVDLIRNRLAHIDQIKAASDHEPPFYRGSA